MMATRSSFVSILNNDDNPSFAVRSSPSFYTSSSAPPPSDYSYSPYPFDPVTEAAAQPPASPGCSSDCSQDYATSSCGSTIQPTLSTTTTTTPSSVPVPSDSRRSPADPPSPQTSSSLSGSKESSGSKRGIRKNKYPCPYAASHGCASTFTTSGHAARHGKKHTGEKSVHCPICNKAFTRKDNMKQHIRTHRTHSEDMNNNPGAGERAGSWTKRTPPSSSSAQHHRSVSQSGSGLLSATSRQAPY